MVFLCPSAGGRSSKTVCFLFFPSLPDQEGPKWPKMILINSPTDKLSNDTPRVDVICKNKFPVFRDHIIGDPEGPNAQKMVSFNSPAHRLSNDTPHAYGICKNKISVFGVIRGLLGFL